MSAPWLLATPVPADLTLRAEPLPPDVAAVRELVRGTGYFSAAEVDVAAELVEERLARGTASGYDFVLVERRGALCGYSCHGPIACTTHSHDLYWIAVARDQQGRGLGRLILAETELRITAAGGRRVWVETSSRPQYAPTRAFYVACGYRQEALLPDFYAPGDGKVVYCKVIEPAAS